jgi:hypothetical protein
MLQNPVVHCYFKRLHAQQICRASSVVGGSGYLAVGHVSDKFVVPLPTATTDLRRTPGLIHRRCVTVMKFPG